MFDISAAQMKHKNLYSQTFWRPFTIHAHKINSIAITVTLLAIARAITLVLY